MKASFLKLSDREEGPFSEEEVAQLFADGRADRNTPCRPSTGGDWRTIDDYLPMLKYGTQLPNPTPPPPPRAADLTPSAKRSTNLSAETRVAIVDIDLPFLSILKLMLKWMAAAFVVGFCLLIVWAILATLFLGGLFSHLPHP